MLRPALRNRNYTPAFFDDPFDRMFDDAFKNFWGGNELANFDAFKTDVIDQGDNYLLQAELPGFDKSDINIDLKDNLLTISASHKDEKNEENENKYIRRERYYSSYSRSFRVNNVEPGDIDASYNNGVLEVKFPKRNLPPKMKWRGLRLSNPEIGKPFQYTINGGLDLCLARHFIISYLLCLLDQFQKFNFIAVV